MIDLSPEKILADLSSISECIANYLEREVFLDSFGASSDYQINDILTECYVIIIQELMEFGIYIHEQDELLGDWYSAHQLYYLRNFLDSANLYTFVSQNAEDITPLKQIAEDEERGDIYPILIEYLSEKHPDEERIIAMTNLESNLHADERLKKHISAVIANVQNVDVQIMEPDTIRAQRYIQKTKILRDRVRTAVYKIIDNMPISGWDRSIIEKFLNDYDLDKLRADQIAIYSTIDLDEVDPTLEPLKKKYLDIHHKRSIHHIEYWLDADKTSKPILQKEHLVLLVAHHDEPDTTNTTFWQKIDKMLVHANAILTQEQKDLVVQMATCLYTRD